MSRHGRRRHHAAERSVLNPHEPGACRVVHTAAALGVAVCLFIPAEAVPDRDAGGRPSRPAREPWPAAAPRLSCARAEGRAVRWHALGTVLPGSTTSGGVTAGLALEESRRGRGPDDGVLPLVPADALKGKRGSYDVRSTARMTRAGCARRDHSYWQGASRIGWSKMRVPLAAEPGLFQPRSLRAKS